MKQQIPDYCKTNTLLIPDSLFDMADAFPVMTSRDVARGMTGKISGDVGGHAAIFYKCIAREMRGIEFYTSAPCLAFVLSGEETFTSFDGEEILLKAGEMLMMPKNLYMISDFVKGDGALQAFLFFFDQKTIGEFIQRAPYLPKRAGGEERQGEKLALSPYKISANSAISGYMEALHLVYRNYSGTANLLRLKLLELLSLVDALDDRKRLRDFLGSAHKHAEKRNIRHLMKEHCFHNLSVQDLAVLSGRSQASFTREFKRQYGVSPVKWLINTRLEKARGLIRDSSHSVTEIALLVGYDNISYFIKAFKTRYGMTPKKMRAELLC
ncbi:AraC family transcriptional regulator [Kiloniella laminariae]|uniref:AraC family transcriptional regulator n=1 Tax=Kiloniella laminariae TaxID=454162 RepID=A0ABT4LF61_9PROT|nr:AraC family transcriptional regulator [Kiloniella laminariae]MCZ4279740.1 AraC family transcriptional regulator [Kiloniella laminariae]